MTKIIFPVMFPALGEEVTLLFRAPDGGGNTGVRAWLVDTAQGMRWQAMDEGVPINRSWSALDPRLLGWQT